MPRRKADEHDAGIASPTQGPHQLTRDHMEKTNAQLPVRVPPPDAEMGQAETITEKP
jgi:hypothetical protein